MAERHRRAGRARWAGSTAEERREFAVKGGHARFAKYGPDWLSDGRWDDFRHVASADEMQRIADYLRAHEERMKDE